MYVITKLSLIVDNGTDANVFQMYVSEKQQTSAQCIQIDSVGMRIKK